jgi:glutamate 5-kinase
MIRLKVNGFESEISRIVLKLGTKQVTDLNHINTDNIAKIVREVADFRKKGVEFILTVSGAIGLGIMDYRIDKPVENLSIPEKQALAGLGQVKLMEVFQDEFAKYGIKVGQVLLTHFIFENRSSYLNARNTLNTMLKMGIIPVINENDSVAVDEIKFGDNDRLGALVALLIDADLYIMLSDIDGFYKDYETDKKSLLRVVDIDKEPEIKKHAGKRGNVYTSGGMVTKIEGALITNRSCIPAVIANGFKDNILAHILDNISEGTIFISDRCNLNYKKRWISGKKPKGKILVDNGARSALKDKKSLLATGIKGVDGNFREGDLVLIADEEGVNFAMGLSNYCAKDVRLIAGKKSSEIESTLGYKNKYNNVVHIDNMVFL